MKRKRPDKLYGRTYEMTTGCGSLYITINNDEKSLPFELFAQMGKAGGCAGSQTQAIGRMVSLAWRSGIGAKETIKQLLGIACHQPVSLGDKKVTSCSDAIAKAIKLHMEIQAKEEK